MWYIYRITNLINGKTYIGQHKYKKLNDSYLGSGTLIRRAIKEYGKENFKKEILVSELTTYKDADILEILYISLERGRGHGEYNICDGGSGDTCHRTEDGKESRRLFLLGNQYAKGKNIGNKHALGNHLSEETRQRMGQSRIGNSNNGVAKIMCIETGEINRTREWINKGYSNAYAVAKGHQKTCKGLHFCYV